MEPEVVSVADARRLTCLGVTKIYQMMNDGQLATVRIGRRRLVRVESIRRLLGTAA